MARARNRRGEDTMSPYRKLMLEERQKEREEAVRDAAQKKLDAINKATAEAHEALEAARKKAESELMHMNPDDLSEHVRQAIGLDEKTLEEVEENIHEKTMASQALTDEEKGVTPRKPPEEVREEQIPRTGTEAPPEPAKPAPIPPAEPTKPAEPAKADMPKDSEQVKEDAPASKKADAEAKPAHAPTKEESTEAKLHTATRKGK